LPGAPAGSYADYLAWRSGRDYTAALARWREVLRGFDTPSRKLSIISCYFPSGSSGEERQAAKFRFLKGFFPHLIALAKTREFILCGDINIAHQQIDLKNWRGNQKNSGFLPEERAWMTRLHRNICAPVINSKRCTS